MYVMSTSSRLYVLARIDRTRKSRLQYRSTFSKRRDESIRCAVNRVETSSLCVDRRRVLQRLPFTAQYARRPSSSSSSSTSSIGADFYILLRGLLFLFHSSPVFFFLSSPVQCQFFQISYFLLQSLPFYSFSVQGGGLKKCYEHHH